MDRCTREDANLLCDVVGVLVAAHAPLTADIICGVLGIRAGDWNFALRHLAEYLTIIQNEEDGTRETLHRIYHESFADFLRAKVAINRQELSDRLADYCLKWSQLPSGCGRDYALRFAARHLYESRRTQDLEALLLDEGFLRAREAAGQIREYAEDAGLLPGWSAWPLWLSPNLPADLVASLLTVMWKMPDIPVPDAARFPPDGLKINEKGLSKAIWVGIYRPSGERQETYFWNLMEIAARAKSYGLLRELATAREHRLGYYQTTDIDKLMEEVAGGAEYWLQQLEGLK
jgi:hypothetical protein